MSTRHEWWRWIAGASLVASLTTVSMAQGVAVGAPTPDRPAVEQTPASCQTPATPGGSRGARSAGRAAENPSSTGPFEAVPDQEFDGWRSTRPVVRIGQDFTVPAGTVVREVVVVGGDAVIDGRVDSNVVVVAGTLRLGPEARVGRDMVAVAAPVTVADGASVNHDLVVVGGGLSAPPNFTAGGEHVVIGTGSVAAAVQAILPWATQGLLLGRLIVPSLSWMWWVLAATFFVKLVLGLLFERPVRASMDQLRSRPLSAVLVGLLVCLLVGPAFFLLAVSVVGIIVIPFAVCGLFVATLLGKIAVARAVGASVIAEDDPGHKLTAARSFALGFAVIAVAYMVPIVGLVTYLFVGTFGLGAATMALFAGLRRENPARPKPPRPVPSGPAPVPPAPPVPGAYPMEGTLSAYAPPDSPAALQSEEPVPAGAPVVPAAVPVTPAAVLPGTLLSMPKASFLVRAAAFAIDVIVVLFATNLLVDLNSPREFVLLLLVYHVVFWSLKGTTLGGMVCNLRVIRTDGEPVGAGEATIRGLSAILSLVVFGLGALWILFDADRQAWHDRFAGTYVVTVPKHYRG